MPYPKLFLNYKQYLKLNKLIERAQNLVINFVIKLKTKNQLNMSKYTSEVVIT
jgi:hypothetical protein